ncbi:hypothetical protein DYB37_010349 [Aphanomyces astaci]|uniref:Uncharacterized protein n=1 Tax=Aphanomyces astaci TaxID=112090 RepID=A0A3R6Y2K0_APHAT|nr:hypothetical protein DYB37_010349 [Aphanomyces astaci]
MESNMKDPALMQILDKWWASCLVLLDSDGNGTLERSTPPRFRGRPWHNTSVDEYVNLYKRLIYGTSCIYGEKAVLDQHIDDLIEEDWKRDSGGLLSMDKTRLCVSIYELAETWAKGEAVKTFVDFLTVTAAAITGPLSSVIMTLPHDFYVAMGEHVCIKKSRVDDLILLVEDVERDVQSFIDAVTDVATSSCTSSHATTKQQETRRHPTKNPNHHDLCFGNRNVSFDLPSMKTYAQQVAPSYAAYKQEKKTTR